MKTILVPIDFHSASEKVLRYIEDVFYKHPVELQLVSVVPGDDRRTDEAIRNEFAAFENDVLKPFQLNYHFHILRGNLLEEIQHAINFYKPFLVVMGTKGTTLTKALMKVTDCAVLIIPEGSKKRQIKNIVYANDFNAVKTSEAFEPLANLSKEFGAKVHIIHIAKDRNTTQDLAEGSLEYYLQSVNHEYAALTKEDFVSALDEYIQQRDIDVLSLLLRDHGKNTLNSDGKLIEAILSKTEIPVLSLV